MFRVAHLALLVILIGLADLTFAQSLYKYRGPDGEWVYTDRKPDDAESGDLEVRALARGPDDPNVKVFYQIVDDKIRLYATNEYFAPVQIVLGLDELKDVKALPQDMDLKFVVPARDETYLMTFYAADNATRPLVAYRYVYLLGDPNAVHNASQAYRAPFAVAREHRISQAYPYAITHTTADSQHAVDIAMPIGTDVYAARGGTVIDVASTNFRGGLDTSQQGAQANVIRILHDDGTYAIYAHLNWNSIRVRPGDLVQRGQYIADSGNTGFSTGPHLHFAVIRNAGMRLESVPVVFEGPDGAGVVPEVGIALTAY